MCRRCHSITPPLRANPSATRIEKERRLTRLPFAEGGTPHVPRDVAKHISDLEWRTLFMSQRPYRLNAGSSVCWSPTRK